MTRQRVNPFDQGTPERILFDRYRKHAAAAAHAMNAANLEYADAAAEQAAADRYAEALRVLGYAEHLPAQPRLADLRGMTEPEG